MQRFRINPMRALWRPTNNHKVTSTVGRQVEFCFPYRELIQSDKRQTPQSWKVEVFLSPETLPDNSTSPYTLLLFGSHGTDSTMPYPPHNNSLLITSLFPAPTGWRTFLSTWLPPLPLKISLCKGITSLHLSSLTSWFLMISIPLTATHWLHPVLVTIRNSSPHKSQVQTFHFSSMTSLFQLSCLASLRF